MAVLRPFLAILLPTTLISFTKLWFRRSFGGAEQVYILFGSKVMPQIQKTKKNKESAKSIQMSAFLQNRKNPETEIFVFCVITFDPITI